MKDYYGILGVPRGADREEIKRAYRQLARRYHPDVSHEGEEAAARFKEVSEAYEVLSDPERRRNYDLFGEDEPVSSIFGRGFDGFAGPFGDLFNIFFGRGQAHEHRAPRRGSDLLTVVELTLMEAYTGTSRKIELPRNDACHECGGSGLQEGYSHDLCPDCGGEGRHTRTRSSPLGTFSSTTTCSRCRGAGEINTHPCSECAGAGSRSIVDQLEIEIPAGIGDGDRMHMAGRGEAGSMGGRSGDLYIEIRVGEHDEFTRRGADLYADVAVDISEAALGTELVIPTLNGEEKLIIPPGSQHGDTFRLRGRGMPSVRSRAMGDLHITLEVLVPRKLNAEQKRLLKEFRRIEEQKKEAQGFARRLRKAMRPGS